MSCVFFYFFRPQQFKEYVDSISIFIIQMYLVIGSALNHFWKQAASLAITGDCQNKHIINKYEKLCLMSHPT